MKNLLGKLLLNLKLRQEFLQNARATMHVNLVLYILIAVLMFVLIISFIWFLVSIRCNRRRKMKQMDRPHRSRSDWIRSASIEHLRFTPQEIEAHRTSTPHHYEMTSSFADFVRSQNNGGPFYPEYVNLCDVNCLETAKNPVEMREVNHNARPLFQTFGGVNEPKYIYWETRV